ncbi:hypothetical protein VP01_203g6 [Puccinia sorghi]|uniref:Uncharacterized protein n=1 Tax=Puccinia sorghi TaxID=27349 RepID=A0A0L6VB10_9BASI|nr:hypothetical protein VP01_203g6 [Puccinia sorghi]
MFSFWLACSAQKSPENISDDSEECEANLSPGSESEGRAERVSHILSEIPIRSPANASIKSLIHPPASGHSEVLQRLNFLHQAAHYLATVTSKRSPSSESVQSLRSDTKTKESRERAQKVNPRKQDGFKKQKTQSRKHTRKANRCQPLPNLPMLGLSRTLSKSMKIISKKAVLRMDPSVKRSICRSCHLLLLPGHTSSTRVIPSSSHQHKVQMTCLACQHQRHIPHPPESITPEKFPTTLNQSLDKTTSRQEQPIPFWRQPQHVTFAAQAVVEGSI